MLHVLKAITNFLAEGCDVYTYAKAEKVNKINY